MNKSNIKPKKSKTNDNKNELKIGMNSKESLPKKPINPYLIFCQENRTSVQEKYQQENNASYLKSVFSWVINELQLILTDWNVSSRLN